MFCSSIAIRNSLEVAEPSLERKPFISHQAPQVPAKAIGWCRGQMVKAEA